MANRLAGSRRFQEFCARVPGLAWLARREGRAIFDLMQGFVQSQVLMALVELRVLHLLSGRTMTAAQLAAATGLPEARALVLAQAGAGLGLLRVRGGRYGVSARGAAFLSVPGLESMVAHHRVLYADLSDPVAFFRGETAPELAAFWPYVFGAAQAADPKVAARYSALMADSQAVVAAETLRQVDFSRRRCLMDVGGGTGAFLRAVHARHPALPLILFDLPAVVAGAVLPPAARAIGGSFRDDPLPTEADTISLVRVLYDHADATVDALLRAAHTSLPSGGRLVISEPMSGGARPDAQTDVYFSVYTLAMGTGRARSAETIAEKLHSVGFSNICQASNRAAYISSVVFADRGRTAPQV